MIVLGLILVIIGWLAAIHLLLIIGIALVLIGLVLNFVPYGGPGTRRRRWY